MSVAVLGIDPGVNGGLAVLTPEGGIAFIHAFKPEMTHIELVATIKAGIDVLHKSYSRSVFMEKVGYMPTDGGQGAFTFGRIDGLIRGSLLAYGYPPVDVMPMQWQAALECMTGGNKNVSKRRAQELWPDIKWTHAIADAALIAEFGRRRLAL